MDFDDSVWNDAIEVSREAAEWGDFVERPIPHWRWSELLDYQSQTVNSEGAIECALPYNAQVTPYIRLKAKGGEKIVICTDADADGHAIAGLLINFLNLFPELYDNGMVCRSISPIPAQAPKLPSIWNGG